MPMQEPQQIRKAEAPFSILGFGLLIDFLLSGNLLLLLK
jgi:hypothetical protein